MSTFSSSVIDLYSGNFIDEIFPSIKNTIVNEVVAYAESEITNQDEQDLADKLFDKYCLDFPEIHIDQVSITTDEKEIPAENFPFEFNVFPGKSYKKDIIVYHIPYSGDIDILTFRPNPFSLSGGSRFHIDRSDKCLLLEVINFHNDNEKIKKHYEDSLKYLTDRNYNNLKDNCGVFNSNLKSEILDIIAKRKAKIQDKKRLILDLGVPLKKVVEKENVYRSIEEDGNKATKEEIAYDLAMSFAGEDRFIAEKIAERLKSLGYSIFYDRYEQANLWGKDLYSHLNDVYKNKARYCLMIISNSYAKKHWTNHERQAAQAKAFKQNEEYILPLRLDDTEIPGINITVGYVDYNQTGFDDTIKLLIDKIGK